MQGDAPLDRTYPHDLELLAAQALARNDCARAFELSDRRCRILPAAQASSYLLRAESSYRMKHKAYAIADLDKALDLAPDDAQANHRMLAWSKGKRKAKAARSLLANSREVAILRKAIGALHQQGSSNLASLTVLDEHVEGWVVWSGDAALEVEITTRDNTVSFFIDADPFHILRIEGQNAASFSVARPRSSVAQSFAIRLDGERIFSCRAPGNAETSVTSARPDCACEQTVPTVIIPIYADFDATKACLDSVQRAMQSDNYTVLLISDAPPDQRITRYLDDFIEQTGIRMLVNSTNMGFVGSINRALEAVPSGDVVLLNADTIVPPGFVGRLAAAAHSSPDIGTVVPLTNNGEFSSFPIANEVNELGSADDIATLDRIAAQANRSVTVDIPSGIGFCLYITRACLNAVGHLSEHYQRGYLEDVDFCLRARECGFRSVCAPSIYVAHEGSRSFKTEKRSLVVRNLQVLDERFPQYRSECAAFVSIDPLRAAREAIERGLDHATGPRVIVVGTGTTREMAQFRSRAAQSQNEPVLLLEISRGRAGIVARPIGPDGAAPQNMRFNLQDESEQNAFDRFLDAIRPSRFEIIDPAAMPSTLLERIAGGSVPYDLFIADSGLFYPPELSLGIGCAKAENASIEPSIPIEQWRQRWMTVAAGAENITTPGAMAKAFASRFLPEASLTLMKDASSPNRPRPRFLGERLGIVAFRNSANDFQMIRDISCAILNHDPDMNIVIIGSTMDDRRLMKSQNVHVTGMADADEFDRIVEQYDLGAVWLGCASPLFGHRFEHAAIISGLPVARFDWSNGTLRARDSELLIDPDSTSTDIASLLLRWMRRL